MLNKQQEHQPINQRNDTFCFSFISSLTGSVDRSPSDIRIDSDPIVEVVGNEYADVVIVIKQRFFIARLFISSFFLLINCAEHVQSF